MKISIVGILAFLFVVDVCALPFEHQNLPSKRQLVLPEVYCKDHTDRPECKMIAALEHDDNKSGESNQRPEKRFDMLTPFNEPA
jgi:hypothetical protein